MRGMRSPKSRAILSSDMHISPHMRPWRAEQGARTCPGLSSAARIWLSSPTCPSQLLQTARGGGEESGGHVLRETTSRGLWTSAQHASTHASRRLWARLRAAANSPLAIRRRRRSSPAQQAGSPIAPAARTRTWKIARGASPLQIKMVLYSRGLADCQPDGGLAVSPACRRRRRRRRRRRLLRLL